MLRLLSIRNFVVVDALELELDDAFTVLTGETGAGKSILLDALGLLLGDRFEVRQLRAGAERAELAAVFESEERPSITAWLAAHDLGTPDGQVLLSARWTIADRQGTPLRSGNSDYHAPGGTPEQTAASMSSLAADLSRDIAQALRDLETRR